MDLKTIARGAGAWLGLHAAPLELTFELTHRCNLSCRYCDRHRALGGEMTTPQILGVLEQFHRLGMRRISLDGGDPLLHRDIDRITEWLAQRQVTMVMNTNGILIPKRLPVVQRLRKVKISLDGPREQHDAMRGNGAFQRALAGARAARAAGVEVELTCVVGQHNAAHIEPLLHIVEQLQSRIVLQPARPSLMQNPERDGSGWQLPPPEVRAVFAHIERLKRDGRAVANRWSSLRHYRRFPDDVALPCAAGWVMATMDPEGVLFACDQSDRAQRHNSVLTLGVKRAVRALDRSGCSQCWCARVVEGNYAWGGQFHTMVPPLRVPGAEPALARSTDNAPSH